MWFLHLGIPHSEHCQISILYDSFLFVQLQGKHCTKKALFNEHPYEKALFSTMLALKKALKGKKWEEDIYLSYVGIPTINGREGE